MASNAMIRLIVLSVFTLLACVQPKNAQQNEIKFRINSLELESDSCSYRSGVVLGFIKKIQLESVAINADTLSGIARYIYASTEEELKIFEASGNKFLPKNINLFKLTKQESVCSKAILVARTDSLGNFKLNVSGLTPCLYLFSDEAVLTNSIYEAITVFKN